jgi:RHS repeat-associated protein
MTSNNGAAYTYDARDELTSDGSGNSFTYTADGDQLSQTGPTGTSASSTSDAYGQQIADGSASSFTWDALNRVVTAAEQGSSITLTYDGLGIDVASDSSASYSRDPSGQVTGVDAAGVKMIALDDQHDDLSGMFTASGSTLTASTTYDPWGSVLAATGPSVQIGYQGQWTDPATHQVNMGSRFYRAPDAGGFTTKDTKPASSSANMYAYADDNPMTVTDPSGHAPSGKGSSGPSASQVAAAGARATKSAAKAAAAQAAYDAARAAAAAAAAAAHSAAAVARQLNSAAAKLAAEAAKTSRQAAAAFAAARAQLRVAESWQDKANQAFGTAAQDVDKAIHEPWYEKYKSVGDLWDAGKETAEALIDEGHAALALAQYGMLEAKAIGLEALADTEHGLATAGKLAAKGAAAAARTLDAVADTAARDAQTMGTIASRDSAEAENDAAVFAKLSAEYARDLAHKVAKAAKDVGKKIAKVAKKVGKAVGKAAVAVGKAVYKASGAQAVVSCVTNPHLSSCAKAAITVAAVVVTTVATAGAGDVAIGAADAAAGAAEDAGADAGADAAEDAGGLAGRVDELHSELDPIAQGRRTTAIMSTEEGSDILASGGRDLSPAQRALANGGDILARSPGAHAEITALQAAEKAGLTPSELAVSRPICPACQAAIEDSGGVISKDLKGAVWP